MVDLKVGLFVSSILPTTHLKGNVLISSNTVRWNRQLKLQSG